MTAEHLEAGIALGDFRIEKRIGSGGMGIVYKARSKTLDRPVALKVLGPRMDHSSATARFRREAQAIAKLQHPGIAAVHYVGQDNSVCYLAMEYIAGYTVQEIIAQLRVAATADSIDGIAAEGSTAQDQPPERFDTPTIINSTPDAVIDGEGLSAAAKTIINGDAHVRRCCELVRDVALALSHAHDRQVVHRDIKPGNLMLDTNGRVYLIDFGLARFYEDATLTYTGQLVGTPIYMSPEQVTGRITIDHRTDIYSLGLVLYQLLSLEPPINGENREQVFQAIIAKQMTPLSWKNNAVSRELEAVVHTAIAKDPDQRYQSATGLAEDLSRVLAGEPVKAEAFQFRLDESEIHVARPPGVLNIGMALIALGCMFFAVGVSMIGVCLYQWTVTGLIEDSLLNALPFSGGAAIFGAGLWTTGKGTISGRRWARHAGAGAVGFCGLTVTVLSAFLILKFRSTLVGSLCFLLIALTISGTVSVIRCLMSNRTEKWLTLASEKRAEFKRLRDTAA